jgi:RNase P protein component
VGFPPEHAHILWVKPYVRYARLKWMWREITNGTATGITSKTVRGDKAKRNDVRRLVKYLVEQEDHHGLPVSFIHSHKWLVRSKEKSHPDEQAVFKGLEDVQTP